MSDHHIAPVAPVAPVAPAVPVTSTASASASTSASAASAAPATSAAPVLPVAAHQPPYYAAVFTSLRTEGDAGYGATAERMGELVKEIPGFLGEDSARTPGGLSITVAYFRDLAGIEQWRDSAEHRAAKARGRAHWYERYSLHIARVEHSHGFERAAGH